MVILVFKLGEIMKLCSLQRIRGCVYFKLELIFQEDYWGFKKAIFIYKFLIQISSCRSYSRLRLEFLFFVGLQKWNNLDYRKFWLCFSNRLIFLFEIEFLDFVLCEDIVYFQVYRGVSDVGSLEDWFVSVIQVLLICCLVVWKDFFVCFSMKDQLVVFEGDEKGYEKVGGF